MKRKKLKTPALYYVIAIILIGVLAFSGYQALRIYLPQSKESGDFASVKEKAGIEDISAQEIIDQSKSSKPSSSDNPDDQEETSGTDKTVTVTDNSSFQILTESNSDFVG